LTSAAVSKPIGKASRVWVAGHGGLVGGAIAGRIAKEGAEVLTASRAALDLRRQADVEAWMDQHRPDTVIIAAAIVGGIQANRTRPTEFLYDNLMIEANIIHAAHAAGVGKLVFLSSSCVYPRLAPQPVSEMALLTGPLEPTNEWYAVAKIAGQKLCDAMRRQYGRDFISIIPATIYGPGDNFDLEGGHVLPSLMRRFHAAKVAGQDEVRLWGTGSPVREFLYVEDLADAVLFLIDHFADEGAINVPAPKETSIAELASLLAAIVGYSGRIAYDPSKPDGMPRKVVDGNRILAMGWKPRTTLAEGLQKTYRWYIRQLESGAPIRGHGVPG
jgi:GDP-L-fucose synthase